MQSWKRWANGGFRKYKNKFKSPAAIHGAVRPHKLLKLSTQAVLGRGLLRNGIGPRGPRPILQRFSALVVTNARGVTGSMQPASHCAPSYWLDGIRFQPLASWGRSIVVRIRRPVDSIWAVWLHREHAAAIVSRRGALGSQPFRVQEAATCPSRTFANSNQVPGVPRVPSKEYIYGAVVSSVVVGRILEIKHTVTLNHHHSYHHEVFQRRVGLVRH